MKWTIKTARWAEWRPWFAWHPVFITASQWVWLEWVERRWHPWANDERGGWWDYRGREEKADA